MLLSKDAGTGFYNRFDGSEVSPDGDDSVVVHVPASTSISEVGMLAMQGLEEVSVDPEASALRDGHEPVTPTIKPSSTSAAPPKKASPISNAGIRAMQGLPPED